MSLHRSKEQKLWRKIYMKVKLKAEHGDTGRRYWRVLKAAVCQGHSVTEGQGGCPQCLSDPPWALMMATG